MDFAIELNIFWMYSVISLQLVLKGIENKYKTIVEIREFSDSIYMWNERLKMVFIWFANASKYAKHAE